MIAYIIRRIVYGAAVLLGTSIITFTIAFVIPADPAVAMAGAKADPQTLATIRHQLGLDQPVYLQYAHYLDRALHGDLGRSYIRRASVTQLDPEPLSRHRHPGAVRDGAVARARDSDGDGRGGVARARSGQRPC